MARPGRASLRLLRTALLLTFLATLGGLVVLLVLNRGQVLGGQGSGDSSVPGDLRGDDTDAAVVSTGFRKTFEQEGRTLFEIAGERLLADREDNVFLEGVELSFSRADGLYRIYSRKAEYNQVRGEARLEGEVVVVDPGGMKLYTEWLELSHNGNLLETSRGTRFELGADLVGRATHFRMDFVEETVLLRGGVLVRSRDGVEPALRLRAQEVLYLQANRLARAQGRVVVRRGPDELRSERLSLYLDEVEDIVRYVRALWKVRGLVAASSIAALEEDVGARGAASAAGARSGAEADELDDLAFEDETEEDETTGSEDELLPGSGARFRGASLALALNRRSEIESLDLEGVRKLPAVFAADDGSGLTRRVTASGIRVGFDERKPRSIDALGDVELVELDNAAPDRPLREATAKSLHAEFDGAGKLALAELRDAVTLREGDLRAVAARAEMQLVQDRIELIGAPEVELFSDQGELRAPRVTFNQDTGLLLARGGVRSELAPATGAVARGPLGDGDEPVRVEAQEALLRRGSSEFLFRDQVRAWSGASVLFADQLRGSSDGTELAASGGVRSLLTTSAQARAEAGATAGDAADGRQASDLEPTGPRQIEVTSDILTYSEASEELVYQGEVVALQNQRRISCDRMEVELDANQNADKMHCLGSARIVDPASSRTIRAERAEYDLSRGEVILFGEPLTLEDPAVGKVAGYRLWYSMESGLFKMGDAGGAAPTDS
ncbi:MAG: hypothetical protein DWQ36_04310 [Acidobacteria bacterium]|nr:MAG: hypothetical protein DWQ30_09190 [Acidobacteriota bacterium]REK10385.1 MAG: hypothetical protein DWQ36_04310 [Acidobacteriota bacterium]